MKTKAKKMKPGGGIFELLEPSKAKKKGVHGRYNGVHYVKIYSTGKAVIDQDYQGKLVRIVLHLLCVITEMLRLRESHLKI